MKKDIRNFHLRATAPVLLGLALASAALAQSPDVSQKPKVMADGSDISVMVKGEPVTFNEGKPMFVDEKVLVPFRAVLEKMGSTVSYDASTKKIDASQGTHKVLLTIDSNTATVDGRELTLEVAPRVTNGTTYIPLRFVSEALGGKADWSGANRTVMIEPAAETTATTTTGTDTQPIGNDPANSTGNTDANNAANAPTNDTANTGTTVPSTDPATNAPPTASTNATPTAAPSTATAPVVAETPSEPINWGLWIPIALAALAAAAAIYWLMTRRRPGQVIASNKDSNSK